MTLLGYYAEVMHATFILEHVGEIMAARMIYKYNVIIIADVRHYLSYMF